MVCGIRVSMTFAAVQRCEMGRYEVPWEGFGIWIINYDFHKTGI